MSKPFTPDHAPARTSPRPTSTGSYFADSAIHMDMSTPTRDAFATPPPLKSLPPLDALYSTSSHLFERLTQLAAAAWDAEQDGQLRDSTVEALHKQLDKFETYIQNREAQPAEVPPASEEVRRQTPSSRDHSTSNALDSATAVSQEVLDSLTSTISSLRLRHAEHRHLLQLSTSHLETISQRCLAQQRTIEALALELQALRDSHTALQEQNEELDLEVQDLRAENTSKDVAMEAMAGAVSGLEGWIENTLSPPKSQLQPHTSDSARRKRQREVIRGRGRFRGRYYVEESDDEHTPEMDVQDVHDGVKAWLRGFRDVEEGLKETGRDRRTAGRKEIGMVDDDWGDFESAA